MKVVFSTYFSDKRLRPTRASSHELVTPPLFAVDLEEDDLALLDEQSGLMRDEELCALDDALEFRLAASVTEGRDVRDADSLRTRHSSSIPNDRAAKNVTHRPPYGSKRSASKCRCVP